MLNANSYLTGIKAFKKDDDMILDAKARDKREKDFYEAQKKREEARKLAMERAQKQKAEREARERAAKEAREKAAREKASRAKAVKEAAKKTRSAVKDLHKGHSTGGNTGGNQPVKTPSGKQQGLMTAAQRDAEEKSYYESPIKTMHQAEKDDAGRYTDTGTGGYEAVSDYAKDIAWREKQDEMVYEDRANGWKAGGGILGAGSKAHAEDVENEWKEFTSGQIHIPDLTFFDSVEAQKSSRDISATEVTLDKAIPGAIAGATVGLPFFGASIPVAVAGEFLSSIGGSVLGSVLDPSLESSGPSETFRIIARDEDQKITTFYEATKYNQGGIDMITTIRADGVVDGIVTRDYYPYDSFKEE